MSTLKVLHSEMGTNFWIPKVRFGDLDLHKLFVEVTSRGGIEQVVRENKWKDVVDAFNFPESQRNQIFTKHLRSYYYWLLHDYEIIYFFKARGQFPPFIGVVYGKIKSGYLVTFTMGSRKLEGVLYECTENRVTQDPERQGYDVFPNTLTDKANPQSTLWNQISEQQKTEQWPPKQNTEADAAVEESEETQGCSEKDENYYSDSELEQRSPRCDSDSYGERP